MILLQHAFAYILFNSSYITVLSPFYHFAGKVAKAQLSAETCHTKQYSVSNWRLGIHYRRGPASYMQIIDCSGISAPDPGIVQGSAGILIVNIWSSHTGCFTFIDIYSHTTCMRHLLLVSLFSG